VADPCVSPKPCLSIMFDDSMPEVFPACAVTQAMAKQIEAQNSTVVPASRGENPPPWDVQQSPAASSNLTHSENTDAGLPLTKEQLIKDQQADPELPAIAEHTGAENNVRDSPVSYFMKNGVLMKK